VGGRKKDADFFRLDPAGEDTLEEQLFQRLREGICRGRWRSGETLPNIRTLAALCGTSVRVPRAAFARLQDENLVKTRSRRGTVVLAGCGRVWRGRVLLVDVGARESYYHSVFYGVLVERLVGERFRVERAWVRVSSRGAVDLGDLKRSLSEPFDLVIVANFIPSVVQAVRRSGSPCFLVGRPSARIASGCVGFLDPRHEQAAHALARRCQLARIRCAVELNFAGNGFTATQALGAAGIAVERIDVRLSDGERRLESFLRAGLDAVAGLVRRPLPDFLFVADDYLALGALQALADAGRRAPGDLKLAVFSNYGFGPVYPVELTRIEANANEDGAVVADSLIRHLTRGVVPGRVCCDCRLLPGVTL